MLLPNIAIQLSLENMQKMNRQVVLRRVYAIEFVIISNLFLTEESDYLMTNDLIVSQVLGVIFSSLR